MISSASFTTQTDFFARLLSQKLENLDNNSKLSQSVNIVEDFFTKTKNSCNTNDNVRSCSDKLQRILDNGIHSSDRIRPSVPPNGQVLGTTFPPNRFVSCDLIRAKFQKESNFLHQIHLKGQQQHQGEAEMSNLTEPVDIPLSNGSADSEMLFDFDIGSPETPEETCNYNKIVNGMEDMEMENLDINYSKMSHTSEMFLQSLSSPDDSITCQSTSSGLFSEPFTPSPPEKENHSDLDDLNENSLFPEEWFINHLNSNDEVTPKVLSPVTSNQNMSNGTNENDQIPESESDKDMGFEDFKVPIGNKEKTVASSKLEALLSQLQSDPKPVDWSFENSQKTRILSSSKIISTSPANFSYLKGSDSDVDRNIEDEVEEVKTVSKSFSVYEMSEYEKSALIEESGKGEATTITEKVSHNEPTEDSKNKYRKCSSLRSGKTPPSTPGRRKIVRFADIFGLDLADVKTFLDDIPKVPKSAFRDLKDADISDLESDSGSDVHSSDQQHSGHTSFPIGSSQPTPTIAPLFNQPGGSSEFFNVLRDKKICLENAFMADSGNIRGTVRVVNLDFNKKVVVRYTFDDWATSETIDGVYLQGSCDGFSDKFTFLLDYKQISGMVGKRLQFVVKFECLGFEYWDNNFGRNYIFQVFGPVTIRPTTPTPAPSCYINTPSTPMAPYVPKSSGRSSSFRRRSAPICARPAPTVPSSTHFSTFSHSPSTSDDPWLRY